MLSYVLRSPRTIDNPTNLPSPQTEGEKGPEMKNLISLVTCLTACLMLAACTHTYTGETDMNGLRSSYDAKTGPSASHNDYVSNARQSQFTDCMKVHEGEPDAEETCKDYIRASMPNSDPRCDDCVDNPMYGYDRLYGGYGY